ncbi:MAG: 6-phosphofructokinase [Candidatus Shikimatogenerans bostrichidophilus]|nr:MAG: 6-phosphofructokinase [Candidatus Shikimatogenerans bostrichidophilus]
MILNNIGILTSGGDSPGMNSAIKAIVNFASIYNIKVFGFLYGYKGLILNNYKILSNFYVNNIIHLGGTILGTSRSKLFFTTKGREISYKNLKKNKINALIVIGGNGTLKGISKFSNEYKIPIIGIPGTIDNDIYGTDLTLGYDTALNSIVNTVDNLKEIAYSNNRIFIIEVMGKNTGYLAYYSGIALSPLYIVHNNKYNLNNIQEELKKKKIKSNIIIVAENKYIGNASKLIYKKIKKNIKNYEFRHTILGYIQRGGKPSSIDRLLGYLFGKESIKRLINYKNNIVLGVKNNKIINIKLKKLINFNKKFNNNNFYNIYL